MDYTTKFFNKKQQMTCLKNMCENFANEADKDLNWDHWFNSVGGLVENGIAQCISLYCDKKLVGFAVLSYFPDLISGQLYVTEGAFYIVPEHRNGKGFGFLLDVAEYQAKQKQAKQINMIALSSIKGGKAGLLYQRRGYKELERVFFKRFD